jgi:hypothetical protein
MRPRNGGAGDGNFTRLKTTPTARPVPNASSIALDETA